MSFPELENQILAARYQLLCRASLPSPTQHTLPHAIETGLNELSNIIHLQLPELARQGSPDNIADLLAEMIKEYQRLSDFCEFPALGNKVIVGIGGAFSTGKSTFINTLLGGKKRLAVELDETTALPSYLMQAEQDKPAQIFALNLFNRLINLSQEEFLSLTHEEQTLYGSKVSALLRSAYLTLPDFPWQHLSLLDTPGYSKPDDPRGHLSSDANIARSQLNASQFIIWLVQADAGVISEQDLAFLATLRRDIPLLVIVSRADKKPEEEITAITRLISDTLSARGIMVLDVIPFSSRKKKIYPIDPILDYLNQWEQSPQVPTFAINFSKLFLNYRQHLSQSRRSAGRRLHKINRILTLSDNDVLMKDAQDLKTIAQQEFNQVEQLETELNELRRRFFNTLTSIGEHLGMAMPESNALELLTPNSTKFLTLVREFREQQQLPDPDELLFQSLMQSGKVVNLNRLVLNTPLNPALISLTETGPVTRLAKLLRTKSADGTTIQALLP